MENPLRTFFTRLSIPEENPPWTLGSALLTVGAAFIAVIAMSGFVAAWMGERPGAPLIAWTFAMLAIIAFVLQARGTDRPALRLDPPHMPLPLLLALHIAFAMIIDLAGQAVTGEFTAPPELLPLVYLPSDTLSWLFAALFMVLIQPIAEGMIFQGLLLPALRAALGSWLGLIGTALAFAIFHFAIYSPTYINAGESTALWYGLVAPLLRGLVFASTRVYTGSTRAAITSQAAFGLFELIKVFILVR
jgi:membrane protease YdiL (CAAX protease family)